MSEKDKTTERKRYSIEVEPNLFDADGKIRYMTSVEFCRAVNEYFAAAFDDYNGCKFVMDNNGPATIAIYFNHVANKEDGKIYACEPQEGKVTGNSILDRTRSRDNRLRNGDRYLITEDGKDIIIPLLIPRLQNNGNPDLHRIVTDIYDNNGYNYFNTMNSASQLTQVVGIDVRKVCEIIWGSKCPETGDFYDYSVQVMADLNRPMVNMPGVSNPNYVLVITQANSTHLVDTCNKLGINTMSSNIVRK